MAQRTIVQMFDDLDGTTGGDIRTVEFGLDGVLYEIDLSDANRARLHERFAAFVDKARRTGGARRAGGTQAASATSAGGDGSAIRAWARDNGHEISDRGRIPGSVLRAFEEANRSA